MLKTYRLKKRKIKQLEFELFYPAQTTEEELVRAMAISGSIYGSVHTPNISDKTMSVAAHYGSISDRMNKETVEQIKSELRALVQETSKLELYVSLLDASQAQVIRLRDFEGKPWSEIEALSGVSEKRLSERRRAGITELVIMYDFVDEIAGNSEGKE